MGSEGPPSSKPSGKSFSSPLARAQAVEGSRERFQQATAPKPTYTDPKGNQHPINPTAKPVETLRREVTPEQYANRPERKRQVFGPMQPANPPVFRDPFGPFFYLWLLERATADDRARWAYNHRAEMDQARWADMVGRDPQLEARVRQLEAQGRPADPTYVPEPIKHDPDLMYNDGYVAAVWNPQSAPQQRPSGFPWGAVLLCVAFLCVVLLGAICVGLWVVRKQSAKRPAEGPGTKAGTGPQTIDNPLGIECGSLVTIDELDFRGKNYRVVEIQEYDHDVGGKHFRLVNYVLQFDNEVVRVRAVRGEDRLRAMLLTLYDDLAYNEALHNTVRDDTGKFVVDDAEARLHEEYWRVEDVRQSYHANVTKLHRESKDSAPQVSHSHLEYWDYWRDTEVDGVKVTQYLYVEMDADTGWFQIWRGMETDPERILAV
jgi:hypothetical protein